jgi:putative ABC transport system permease protein
MTNNNLSLDGFSADLRQALRALRTAPGFTFAALLVLVLGIGASTAIFSVVDAVVLRGLPYDDASQLVAVGERNAGGKSGKLPAGFPAPPGMDVRDPLALSQVRPQNYFDWVDRQRVFESIAAMAFAELTLVAPDGHVEALAVQRVTANFFDVLRIRPALGRAFTADREIDGNHRVAVVGNGFWHRRFGGDPKIVGQSISLDGATYEVVGVMPAGARYPPSALTPPDLWIPYVPQPFERTRGRIVGANLQSIARLSPGVSLEQAQSQMAQVAAQLEAENPTWNRGSGIGVRPLQDHLVGASVRSWMLMLLAAVGIVLLISCINVANLLLARDVARRGDQAIRAALGASRWRLVRPILVESFLLSSTATGFGVVLAWWAVDILRSAMPDGIPRQTAIALDLRVFGTACGIALVTGALFAILPALRASPANVAGALDSRTAWMAPSRQRLRSALVVAEIALAVVLVAGSFLFTQSFVRTMRIVPGFNPEGVLTTQLYQPAAPGQPPVNLTPAFGQIVDRLNATDGVLRAAAVSPGIPLRPNMRIDGFVIPGRVMDVNSAVSIKWVTPLYFEALEIPMRRGRTFAGADPASVIINEAAARHFFGESDPIGRTATVDGSERTIIAVVADVRQGNFETSPTPEVYLSMANGRASSAYLVVRTAGNPPESLSAVSAASRAALPTTPLRYIATLDELIGRQTAQRRLTMLMLGLFGVLGLVIAAIGLYGVMSYIVSQRTREIGVRMALGATRARVVRLVLTQSGVLMLAGVALGLGGGWYLRGMVNSFLFGISANDLRPFAAAALALGGAALAATAIPATRAATVDPTVALRAE